MKAILEFDAPEGCLFCPLCITVKEDGVLPHEVCGYKNKLLLGSWTGQRAQFCPLKIVEDGD